MEHSDNMKNGKSSVAEYVTVAIADDMDLANEYRDILGKSDIPAVTATQRSYSSIVIGIAVMVPENYFEQAQEIIESRQVLDDFIDDAFNEGYRPNPNDDYENDFDSDH